MYVCLCDFLVRGSLAVYSVCFCGETERTQCTPTKHERFIFEHVIFAVYLTYLMSTDKMLAAICVVHKTKCVECQK